MRREMAALTVGLITGVCAAGWAPTSSPLTTRWTKEVTPDTAWRVYPRPQFKRENWKNLNGMWDLALREDATTASPNFNRQILVPFSIEAPLSGIGERANHVAYRRHFDVPSEWKDDRVLLHFDAVDWKTSVSLNGKVLKTLDGDHEHEGGYDRFTYDISDVLTTSGKNELVVRVFDPTEKGDQPRGKQVTKSHGIWYTPTTGIWQTVWLEPVSRQGSLRRVVFTPNAASGTVNIKTEAINAADGSQVEISVKTDEGPLVVTMAPNEEADLKIPTPHLWSPENPYLYDVEAHLKVGDKVVDSVKTYFGLRDIEVKKIGDFNRILLNGKEIFQLGLLDQGFWPDGNYTAPTPEALVWDVDYTREMGFNMIRKHIKVEPDIWYHYCDKIGMLVWQDSVNGVMKTEESHRQFERDQERMIRNHFNSPSIVLWTVFNEGWGQYDTERITAVVEKMDPTRLVTNASGWVDKGVGDIIDMHKYPGPGAPDPDPKRASVLGEFGGLGFFVEGHSWGGKLWGYQGTESKADLWDRWSEIMEGLRFLRAARGLCAAVYTQTTDVEIEANGMVTYDREVKKLDSDKVKAVNQSVINLGALNMIARTALVDNPPQWQYTFEKPADDWATSKTAANDWKTSAAGFGKLTKRIFGKVGTPWSTPDVWIRREVELPAGTNPADVRIIACFVDSAEFYINGVKAAEQDEYVTGYKPLEISKEAQATMKPGQKLILAVHCHHKTDEGDKDIGQYIDAGLLQVAPGTK